MKTKIRFIPIALTLSRIIFFFILASSLMISLSTYFVTLSLVAYIMIGASDFLDGFIARKIGAVSLAGKVLDPVIDSVVNLSIIFLLSVSVFNTCIIFPLMILWRDFLFNSVRIISAVHGDVIPARICGKCKTIITTSSIMASLLLLLLSKIGIVTFCFARIFSEILFAICSFASWISIWGYFSNVKTAFNESFDL